MAMIASAEPSKKTCIRRCRPLLGTFVEIEAEDGSLDEPALTALVDAAFERIALVHERMSFHSPTSDVTLLNAEAHHRPVQVHPWTQDVIRHALHYSALSGGVFDISVAPQLVKWGFLPRMQARPLMQDGIGTWKDIVLHDDGTIQFLRPLRVDLGGIAKGFAVDLAAELLTQSGVEKAVVNAGGDLCFVGLLPGQIHLRHPVRNQPGYQQVRVLDRAAATSGGSIASRWHWWRRVTRILHPRTRRSVAHASSATVFAPTCLQADVFAKLALLDGNLLTQPWFVSEATAVLFVNASGQVSQTL